MVCYYSLSLSVVIVFFDVVFNDLRFEDKDKDLKLKDNDF